MRSYRFGDFELDLESFELRKNGAPVRLERRPLDLLVLLIAQPGRLLTREEIIAALWPARVIIDFESGLNTLVRKVRTALEDSSEQPRFIETVPGRGYRFVASVEAAQPAIAPASTLPAAPVLTPTIAPAPTVAPDTIPAGAAANATDTPDGLSIPERSRRTRRVAWVAASLLIVVAGTVFAWLGWDAAPKPTRIAVLPFDNLTGDDSLAYLASGLAEDTSIALAQIDLKNLRVIGIATRAPADASLTADELGHRFGVDFVVMSALRLDQSRIRLTSRLVRTKDSEQVWSASFDRELTNVLGLQRDLSIAIAEQIRLKLSPEVAAAIDKRQTQHPEAYALYLKARYEWSQLTPASTRRGLQYFEQATKEDPDYALAWAGLAFGLLTSVRTADLNPQGVAPRALEALRRAERLGPDLAETQYAEGYYQLFQIHDLRATEVAARRAIALDPNNAQAHMLLAVTIVSYKPTEAVEMMRRSRELDPSFALLFANSSHVAILTGDFAGGLELGKQTVAMNPDFWLGHFYVGQALERLGDLNGALEAYSDAARLSDGHSNTYMARASVLAKLGRTEEIRPLLAALTMRAERQYVPPFAVAVLNALLGDVDAAFVWLNRAVDANDVDLPDVPTEPSLKILYGDPRFDAFLQRCGCSDNESD